MVRKSIRVAGLMGLSLMLGSAAAWADGTETLGPPGIPIASGNGVIAAGTGLASQPGYIDFSVPAGTAVLQVLLYWEGQDAGTFTGDDTIIVNGNAVTGTQIGGPVFWLDNGVSTTYRADITDLELVGPGTNSLAVEGLLFTNFANGAGVLVVVDNGSSPAAIEIRDGNDLAFVNWPSPKDTTVAQTFTFAASDVDRTATLSMLFSAVSGTNSSGGTFRPTAIDVTVGSTMFTFDNLLDSLDGQEWDTIVLDIVIPAGETMLTVQALSVDNLGIGGLPASLTWNAASLSLTTPPPPPGGEGCTPGYWKNHLEDWVGVSPADDFDTTFGVDYFDPDITLGQAVKLGGGGVRKLARHGTAAYVNAVHPSVSYPLSAAEVIAAVQAGDADTLAEFNELGCTID